MPGQKLTVMCTRKFGIFIFICMLAAFARAQTPYWNRNTQLLPWRMTPVIGNIVREDLDKDGDPDILRAQINDSIPVIWIDDDDDMR